MLFKLNGSKNYVVDKNVTIIVLVIISCDYFIMV